MVTENVRHNELNLAILGTLPKSILSAGQDLTGSFVDLGDEINCEGFSSIGIWVDLVLNDSTGVELKALASNETSGTRYNVEDLLEGSGVYVFSDVSQKTLIIFKPNNVVPYLQLQVKASVVGATAGLINSLETIKGK